MPVYWMLQELFAWPYYETTGMKNIHQYILITLMLASQPAGAQWTGLTGADSAKFDYFVDLSTSRKTRAGHEIFVLKNAKTPDQPWQSVKTQFEADCDNRRLHSLFTTRFSGPMGSGTVRSEGDPSAWAPIIPGTASEAIFTLACRTPEEQPVTYLR